MITKNISISLEYESGVDRKFEIALLFFQKK